MVTILTNAQWPRQSTGPDSGKDAIKISELWNGLDWTGLGYRLSVQHIYIYICRRLGWGKELFGSRLIGVG